MTALIVPARYPERFTEDFSSGIGHWTTPDSIGGPREVVGGVFRSWNWSYDTNHLTTLGGPGMLHLMAYADYHYWNYQKPDGSWVTSDFTNAAINMRVRGVSFAPNGSEWIAWITARHPYVANKNVNWGFVAEPRAAALTSGAWTDVSWTLDPDPSKWVWGKGANGSQYDTFLSLQESLQNICNIHFPTLGPDNVAHPSGTFEMDSCEILFNRNGPPQTAAPEGTVVFDPPMTYGSSGNSGYSIRGVSSAIGTGGTQIRVTFKAHPTSATSAGHVSIGKQASGYNTVATPVELKFGGASGFSIAAGAAITSDWADLTTADNDVLVAVIDSTSSGQIRTPGSYAGGSHYNLNGTSWNQATPSGFTDSSSQYFGGKIEVK